MKMCFLCFYSPFYFPHLYVMHCRHMLFRNLHYDPKTKQKNYCKNTHYVRTARRAALYASKNENIFSDDIRYIMDTDSVAVRKI